MSVTLNPGLPLIWEYYSQKKMSAEDFKESASDTGSRGRFVPL